MKWLGRLAMTQLKANRWIAYSLVLGFASISIATIVAFPPDEFGMPTLVPAYVLPVAVGYWFVKHGPYEGPMFLGVALGIAIAVAISYPVVQDWTVWDALGRWALEVFFSIGSAFMLLLAMLYASGVPSIQASTSYCTCQCPCAKCMGEGHHHQSPHLPS